MNLSRGICEANNGKKYLVSSLPGTNKYSERKIWLESEHPIFSNEGKTGQPRLYFSDLWTEEENKSCCCHLHLCTMSQEHLAQGMLFKAMPTFTFLSRGKRSS